MNIRKHRYIKDQRGVTLIELMITMGLLSIFLVILTTIFTSSVDMQIQTTSYAAVTSDGRYSLARLAYDIRRASAITTPTAAGDTGSSLTLTIDGTDYTYAIDSNRLALTVGGDTSYLTTDKTVTSALSFHKLGNGSQESVQYSFTVTGNAGHQDETVVYTSTTERRQ